MYDNNMITGGTFDVSGITSYGYHNCSTTASPGTMPFGPLEFLDLPRMMLIYNTAYHGINNTDVFGAMVFNKVVEMNPNLDSWDIQEYNVMEISDLVLVELVFHNGTQPDMLLLSTYPVTYDNKIMESIHIEKCFACNFTHLFEKAQFPDHANTPCEETNVLDNPGAEEPYSADSAWTFFDRVWEVSIHSYTFVMNSTSNVISQGVDIPPSALSVTVSGYINNSVANSGITGYGYLYGGFPGHLVWIQSFDMTAVGGSSTWVYVTKTVDIPENATAMYVQMRRSLINGQDESGNIALFDNISVVFECNETNTPTEPPCNETGGCTEWGCAPSDYSTCTACGSMLTTQAACEAHGDVTGDTVCAWVGGSCQGCTDLVYYFCYIKQHDMIILFMASKMKCTEVHKAI